MGCTCTSRSHENTCAGGANHFGTESGLAKLPRGALVRVCGGGALQREHGCRDATPRSPPHLQRIITHPSKVCASPSLSRHTSNPALASLTIPRARKPRKQRRNATPTTPAARHNPTLPQVPYPKQTAPPINNHHHPLTSTPPLLPRGAAARAARIERPLRDSTFALVSLAHSSSSSSS